MQTPVEMDLEMMLVIAACSTPSRENHTFLKSIASLNSGIKTECYRILTSPEWMTWHLAQIEIDVEIDIPAAVFQADNAAVLKLLNFYSDDLHIQTRMIAKIQDIWATELTRTNSIERIEKAEAVRRVFVAAPYSDDKQSVPRNIMEVACHILLSVKTDDFLQTEGYDSVLYYVIDLYYSKRDSMAWRVTFINILTNVLCQILTGDVLEKMQSRKWSMFAVDRTIQTLQCVMMDNYTSHGKTLSDSFEKELLRVFSTLYPKITTALIACLERSGFSHTSELLQAYIDLLTYIDKQLVTITDVIPNIRAQLDLVEEAVKQSLEKQFAEFGRYNIDTLTEYRPFFQKVYEFRRKNNLGHIYSARRIVPVIIKMVTWDEDAPLHTPQHLFAIQMKYLVETAFEWLFNIVKHEEDSNICRYVIVECMEHNTFGNIFDIAAKLIFRNQDYKSDNLGDYDSQAFIDFIYCICIPRGPSSRETVAKLSKTKALEMLMVGIYRLLPRLQEHSGYSHLKNKTEETIFKAMHMVVEIVSAVPGMMSTGIVHTCTTTRKHEILRSYRDIIANASFAGHFDDAVSRYYQGAYDTTCEKYTILATANWQTEGQLVVPQNVDLVHHNVTVITLHSLVIKVHKAALPTVQVTTKRLMQLVAQTWT